MAQHLIIHGQTTVAAGVAVDDQLPNVPGTDGEIGALPYTVPAGQKLLLLAQGIEGTREPLSALIPWLGTYPPDCTADTQKTSYRKANSLFTVQSIGGSREDHGQRFILPAGTVLHVRLVNGSSVAYTLAWYLRGVLLDADEDVTPWL